MTHPTTPSDFGKCWCRTYPDSPQYDFQCPNCQLRAADAGGYARGAEEMREKATKIDSFAALREVARAHKIDQRLSIHDLRGFCIAITQLIRALPLEADTTAEASEK